MPLLEGGGLLLPEKPFQLFIWSQFFCKPRVENLVTFPLFLCFPLAKRMFPPCEPYVSRCGTVGFSQRKRKKFLFVRVKIPFLFPYSVRSFRLCSCLFSVFRETFPASIRAHVRARTNYIMQGIFHPFSHDNKNYALQHKVNQRVRKKTEKTCKKVWCKSCGNGKSLYLCNRFREGEPLNMTDWKS